MQTLKYLTTVALWFIIKSHLIAQSFQWTTQGIGAVSSSGTDVDDSGNVYITGCFSGIANFGTMQLNSYGNGTDIFVAKYNSSGTLQWAKHAGGSWGNNDGTDISVDGLGNVYITGAFESSITFDTTILNTNGLDDIFIAKYNSSGILIWVKQAGGNSYDECYGITSDNFGNCYITGKFRGTALFENTSLTAGGLEDIFVAKYDSTGTLNWVQQGRGNLGTLDAGQGICIDGSGNIFIAGFFENTITFGSLSLTTTNVNDIIIAKFDNSGALQYIQNEGGIGEDKAYDIAVDANGANIYITGVINGTSYGSSYEIYVAKYAVGTGILQWQHTTTGNSGSFQIPAGERIVVAPSGNVYVTGMFYNTITFDTETLTAPGFSNSSDAFVVKYNSAGVQQWISQIGGTGVDWGSSIALDNSYIYVTGSFGDVASFGCTTLSGGGSFVSKISPIITSYPAIPIIASNITTLTSSSATGNQWYLNGNVIGGATAQTYSVTQNGTYSVCVTDVNGCSSCSAPLNFTTAGLTEQANEMNISIFPNPSSDKVVLSISDLPAQVTVSNSIGQEIISFNAVSKINELDLNGCVAGFYFVRVTTINGTAEKKIIRIK